jgi:hypothetical protein
MSTQSNVTPIHGGISLANAAGIRPLAPTPKIRRQTYSEHREDFAGWPFGEMSADEIAGLTGASVRTARRWRQDRQLPEPVQKLAQILMRGDLGSIDPAWSGWAVRRGTLASPAHREPFTVGELEHLPFTAQRVASLEATNRRMTQEIERMRTERVESPEKRKLENALHRAWQLERMAEVMLSEFGVVTHECVTEAACDASDRATGDIEFAYRNSDGAIAGESGATAAIAAQDAARALKAFCTQRLAEAAAEERAREHWRVAQPPDAS